MQNITFNFSNQTLAWPDILALLILIVIELFLSIDNGLVLCNLTSQLKPNDRKKALFIGLFTSFILRFLLLFLAIYLLKFPILKALGGLYLLYIGASSLKSHKKKKKTYTNTHFWLAILAIELIDLIFALDSMLAAYSFATIYYPYSILQNKLWIIYLGIIIGIIILRSAVYTLVGFLKKIPNLERIICLFIILMGIKLIVDASLNYAHISEPMHQIMDYIFWALSIITILLGFFSTKSRKTS
jgi:YkoY family integral membrane protein